MNNYEEELISKIAENLTNAMELMKEIMNGKICACGRHVIDQNDNQEIESGMCSTCLGDAQ